MAKTSIYWNDVLDKKMTQYVKRHGGISRALTIVADRYAEIMAIEKRNLRRMFDRNEINLMLNNALSTNYEPGGVIPGAVLADTEDEVDSQFDYFGADRKALIEKLESLNIGQQFALVDYLEELRGDSPQEPEEPEEN